MIWPKAGIAVLCALSLAACGDDDEPRTVDAAAVEQGIKDDLSTATTKVTKASCPNDVEVEQGATFKCSLTFANGATGKVTVTQNGAERYTYELKPGSVQVPGPTVEAAVAKSLAAQGLPNATVKCPANIIVKVGTTVTCDLSGAQGAATGQVTFTFSSEEGAVDASSVEAS